MESGPLTRTVQWPGRGGTRVAPLSFAPAQAQLYNRNLVVNGDAEGGPGAPTASGAQVTNIPGWTVAGSFAVGTYGDGFMQPTDCGPVNRGKQVFWGGPSNKRSTAVQTIDLSAAAADIDVGKAKYYLSGYLGFNFGAYDTRLSISSWSCRTPRAPPC